MSRDNADGATVGFRNSEDFRQYMEANDTRAYYTSMARAATAQAKFDAMAAPETDDDGEELETLRVMIEETQCYLRAAMRAVDRADTETAGAAIASAIGELGGKL